MAKIEGPLMSIEAHGTIGSRLTFSSRKTGQQVRFQNRQVDTQSSAQETQRSLFNFWRQRWNDLSSADKKTYEDYTIANQLNMTGYNYYLKTNISTLLLTDDFSGDSLDTNKWTAFGESYGSISVSGGQCTITQTSGGGDGENMIGIASVIDFPVGVTYKTKVKHTSARHAGVGFLLSPFKPYPHGGTSTLGATIYFREATKPDAASFKDEDSDAGYEDLTDLGSDFVTIEIKRENKNTIKFYVDDILVATKTILFQDKYPFVFSCDGSISGNNLIIDWAKVEMNQ
jgi:hypothetical protein